MTDPQRGALLTVVSRRQDRPVALDVPGHRVALDPRDPDSCRAPVRAAGEHAGRLDLVVNAVGVVAFGPVDELSIDAVEELFMTNTFVPIFLARAALGALGDGGVIVPHTETGLAERPLEGQAPRMPNGLDPAAVAATICDAIAGDVADLPSTAFEPR